MANTVLQNRGAIGITDLKTVIGRIGPYFVRNTVVSMAMDDHESPDAAGIVRVANLVDHVQRLSGSEMSDDAEIPACRCVRIIHAAMRRILDESAGAIEPVAQALDSQNPAKNTPFPAPARLEARTQASRMPAGRSPSLRACHTLV